MKKLLIIALLSFVSANYFAQNGDLETLQKKLNSINDFSADYVQKIKAKKSSSAKEYSGSFLYKRGNKYRIEFGQSILFCDGIDVYNYNPKARKLIISSLDNNQGSYSIDKLINEYPSQGEVESLPPEIINGKEYKGVLIKSDNLEFSSIKIWFNESDFIGKIEAVDGAGNGYSIELKNLKTNQNLSDSDFSCDPPKGTEIVDLR